MRGVERFMKRYFLAARQVGTLTRIFCSAIESDFENKIINQNMPIAKAVLDQEKGDEIDVLVGVKRRKAIIKEVNKQVLT